MKFHQHNQDALAAQNPSCMASNNHNPGPFAMNGLHVYTDICNCIIMDSGDKTERIQCIISISQVYIPEITVNHWWVNNFLAIMESAIKWSTCLSYYVQITIVGICVQIISPSYCTLIHSIVPGTKLKIRPWYHSSFPSSSTHLCLIRLPIRSRYGDETVLSWSGRCGSNFFRLSTSSAADSCLWFFL